MFCLSPVSKPGMARRNLVRVPRAARRAHSPARRYWLEVQRLVALVWQEPQGLAPLARYVRELPWDPLPPLLTEPGELVLAPLGWVVLPRASAEWRGLAATR
jgi:hypothetical protein